MRGRPPRVDNRGAYAQRIANDPKFTPRVGNFWTHDQRHYEPGAVGDGGYAGLRTFSEYWRGPRGARAGFRGGFRGRGRGFPPGPGPLRRGVDGVDAGRELSNGPESGGPRLEMDKLEEMERAKAEPRIKPEPPTEEVTEGGEKPLPPTTPPNERRWGHESFESVRATEQFQANRLPLRARGRGRGGFARKSQYFSCPSLLIRLARGGHFGPFAPHASLPTPEKTPEAAAHLSSPAPLHVKLPAETASPEDLATQPAADGLLTELSEAVTVRLPGGGEITVPPSAPPVSLPELAPNGAAVLYTSPTPHPQEQPAAPAPPAPHPAHVNGVPIHGASPVPYANGQMQPSPQFPTVTGSENGSISSAGPFVPQQPSQYLPPGIGVTPNGDYYNLASGAPVDFHPARPFYPTHPRAFPHQQQQIFPPQSYPPDPYAQQPSHQTAFYRNGYPDGRAGSPYGNHYAQAQLGGLFAPARRTQKVSIRAPSANGTEEGVISSKTPSSGMYPTVQPQPQGQYYSQHYNPYAANGMAIQVPEGTYFDGSGSGYQPQQYGEVPAGYVYEGEYPGY